MDCVHFNNHRIYFRWTAGPEIFGAAGYARCVYIDGDILAATPMLPPTRIKTRDSNSDRYSNSKHEQPGNTWGDDIRGGFSCGLLRTELSPKLDTKPRAGPNSKAPALASPQLRLIAGALESSLGVMLAALGASDHDYALHDSTFGVRPMSALAPTALLFRLYRENPLICTCICLHGVVVGSQVSAQRLFFERLTINTGVLAFDCRVARQRALFLDTVQLAWR